MKQALLSVSDKSDSFLAMARQLIACGIDLLASDGTAAFLTAHQLPVIAISDYLDFEPILDGRVKTLHPKLYGGILADMARQDHQNDLLNYQIKAIEFVVIDLYPFEKKAGIENIDIGGVSLIRAAAKNYQFCTVICDTQDYAALAGELKTENGKTTLKFRKTCAAKAFARTSVYDQAISGWLSDPVTTLPLNRTLAFQYGENPHQQGGFYNYMGQIPAINQIHGQALTYNNILDIDAGVNIVSEFTTSAAAVIKHNIPCGAALGSSSYEAIEKAWRADPKSAFGGVVVLNQPVDSAVADFLANYFIEVIAAPQFSHDAIAILSARKKLRLVCYAKNNNSGTEIKSVLNGFVIQERNNFIMGEKNLRRVTQNNVNSVHLPDLIFAFQLVKHVKSNAIVVAGQEQSIAICAGQTSRVDAVAIALNKLSGQLLANAVLASDGFFPFADSIELIARAGIKTIIQPGGSIRDQEVIEACNNLGISMFFTDVRLFKH
ncbi:bifunctional phosphoribosylaminoimidazolecarboxamide formyltransferase/IMP cyclohydrolase [Legionella dresdenensis]|uniref:Bifunctional purine biosynthesis protein PurH n=1 Tax=Legionella dresdenensis TaxID=450200 RepID=A0ABV8CBB5_9GAMM